MLPVILLGVLLCVVYAVHRRVKWRNAYKLPPSLPGELPIIGHAHIVAMNSKDPLTLIKLLSKHAVDTGGVIYGLILNDLYYFITDPEDALTVANSCLQKHFFYSFSKNWLGNGLITGSGEIYNRRRKLLHPKHSLPTVHNFLNIFNDQARKLCHEMNAYCGENAFDPSNIIKNVILETSCLTTFGFIIKQRNLIKNYMIGIQEMLAIITHRIMNVYLYHDFIYKILGYQKRENFVVNAISTITNKIIQETKEAMKKTNNYKSNSHFTRNHETTKSMVNYLLELGNLLSAEEIREELDTNVVASYDTVMSTLINIILLLGTYPEIQDNIYEELIQVLGVDRDIEKQDLQHLVYTRAVIKESLRVIPSAPAVARYIDKDVKLKNYTIPANSQCFILPYGINRNPAWGADVEQFKPERWLDASLPSNINFAAFSIGKRSCIGMTYAITLLTVILAHLVRQNKWKADITKVKMHCYVIVKAVAGHEITIERRNASI